VIDGSACRRLRLRALRIFRAIAEEGRPRPPQGLKGHVGGGHRLAFLVLLAGVDQTNTRAGRGGL
jgi:hypothetical protein